MLQLILGNNDSKTYNKIQPTMFLMLGNNVFNVRQDCLRCFGNNVFNVRQDCLRCFGKPFNKTMKQILRNNDPRQQCWRCFGDNVNKRCGKCYATMILGNNAGDVSVTMLTNGVANVSQHLYKACSMFLFSLSQVLWQSVKITRVSALAGLTVENAKRIQRI